MNSTKLMWVTPNAEFMMAYMTRGSNPPNQNNPEFANLFRYCLKHGHWSPFQMASMCVEIKTSLAIAAQFKRHWSMAICEPADVQETSMRYMDPYEHGWEVHPDEIEIRKAAEKNRQSSEEPFTGDELVFVNKTVQTVIDAVNNARKVLKGMGAANETLRMLYIMGTPTQFYVSGSARSWYHYFAQRLSEHAQLEHQELALDLWDLYSECFPVFSNLGQLKGYSSVVAQTRQISRKSKLGLL